VWYNLSQAKLSKLGTVWPAQLQMKVKLYICGGSKNGWSYTSTLPIWFLAVERDKFTFTCMDR